MAKPFVFPDRLSKTPDTPGAQEWMAELEAALQVEAGLLGHFHAGATNPPSMQVRFGPGRMTHQLGTRENLIDSRVETVTGPTGISSVSAACFGNGRIVAVCPGTAAFVSVDGGKTWSPGMLPSSITWSAVCFGNGVYIAVAAGSTAVAVSLDGITWTSGVLPISARNVAFGGGVFVVTPNSSNNVAVSNDNGATWTQKSLPYIGDYRALCFGDGVFLTAIYEISGRRAVVSTDGGETWTARPIPWPYSEFSGRFNAGSSSSSGLYLVGEGNSRAAVTLDAGVTWTAVNLPSTSGIKAIVTINGLLVALANEATRAYFYLGGSWIAAAMPASFNALAAGGGRVVAVGGSSTVAIWKTGGPDKPREEQTTSVQLDEQMSPALVSPVSAERIDRIGISAITGAPRVVMGVEGAGIPPAYPDDLLPVAAVHLLPGQVAVTNGHITDERALNLGRARPRPTGASFGVLGTNCGYAIFDKPGVYPLTVAGARFFRLTLVGPGGAIGGRGLNSGGTAWLYPGGGGGGAVLPGVVVAAETLSITVGAPGMNGTDAAASATAGSVATAGTATTVTSPSGLSLSAGAGSVGAPGTATAHGAAGAGAAAPTNGFAGGAGTAGSADTYGQGGGVGEQTNLVPRTAGYWIGPGQGSTGLVPASPGAVLVEWW